MIVGAFDPGYDTPVPLVRAAVFVSGITSDWVHVFFLLDTGASTTCLHPKDAIFRFGITPVRLALPQHWPAQESRYGVGGGATYYPVQASYAFQHLDDTWQRIDGEIRIAQLRADNQTIDSLLGWDILQQFRIDVDHSEGRVMLHSL